MIPPGCSSIYHVIIYIYYLVSSAFMPIKHQNSDWLHFTPKRPQFHQLLGHTCTMEHDFNELKCVLQPQLHPQYFYLINNTQISPANSHKGLGVIMSNDLSWTKHYCHITSCAYRSLHLIWQSFTTNSISAKWQLYLSFVHSCLS